jgi:two-component system, OmpR family, response regulator AdeR
MSQAAPLILIVEDEPRIAEVLEAYLRREGFRTERAADGERALELHRIAAPDLVLLDIQIPKRDGLEVLRELRGKFVTPVILVTARAEDIDKIVGLSLGADDYVVKPFNPQEVVARVKAVLRRVAMKAPVQPIRLGPLEVDVQATLARVEGTRLDLTLTEFKLLEAMAAQPNRSFARSELLEIALPDSEALERVVDRHVSNLRKKLELAGAKGLLETVRGVGYRLWLG